jgi:PAS domain S-box-containing protein
MSLEITADRAHPGGAVAHEDLPCSRGGQPRKKRDMSRETFSLQNKEFLYQMTGFAIAIFAAALVALTSYEDIRRNFSSIDWIIQTGSVIGMLDAAREDSYAAVAALQSYSQTGDRQSLDNLASAVADAQRQSRSLRTLTRENPTQQSQLDHTDLLALNVGALTRKAIQIATSSSREDAIKDPVFADLGAAIIRLRAQYNLISTTERTSLMARAAKLQTTFRHSATLMGAGGGLIFAWLLLVGGYAGMTTDRFRQIAANHRKADDRFRALLETAPDAIVLVNRQGRIVLVNAQTEKRFGYAREELLGSAVEMLVPPRFRGQHLYQRDDGLTGPAVLPAGANQQLYGLRKDNSEFPIEISLNEIATEDGVLVSSVIRDITDRKKAEEKVRELDEIQRRHAVQVEAANKELEAFSYSVSHDLRAPLRSIDGFSLALLEDWGSQLDPEAKHLLDRIRAATQRMARLIDDLLNLGRVTGTEMRHESIDLTAMAKAILAELQSADPQRHVECVVADNVKGRGDTRLMRVVLENLLGNAWKFTMNMPQSRIEVGVAHQDGVPVYFVRDDGPGFDMAYVGKLFGTFQRLHAVTEFPGTGIGLASVQRIIRRHGGRTWAQGAVGKGATFSFTLAEHQGESSNA